MFSCSVFRIALLILYSSSFHRSFSSFSEKCVVFSLVSPGLDLENRAVFSIEGAPMGYGTIGAPSVGKYAIFAGVDSVLATPALIPALLLFGCGLEVTCRAPGGCWRCSNAGPPGVSGRGCFWPSRNPPGAWRFSGASGCSRWWRP